MTRPRPPSCSSACTTPAARRWPPATCSTSAGDRIEVLSAGSAAGRPDQPGRRRGDGRGGHRHRRRRRPRCSPPTPSSVSDVVVTMGCGDACPFFPGKRYEDWELDDPAGQEIEAVRPIRDEIRRRVEKLVAELVP